ncbi:8246_t:CDS:2 [Ambispora gerdemannii]|uniref:8246_t:CDS:1 n=1 Tax=Ambispora gerdemannii TaxID=144530 RepID=A0A9N9FP91_9GLOM|nr:8246_t:CDS:2 [Ambispora gerdemannii]
MEFVKHIAETLETYTKKYYYNIKLKIEVKSNIPTITDGNTPKNTLLTERTAFVDVFDNLEN